MLKKVIYGVLTAASGGVLLATSIAPATASASPDTAAACADPTDATNVSTAVYELYGTVERTQKLEVRRGKIDGHWYGWARWTGHTHKRDTPALYVSFDGGESNEVKCERGLVESDGGASWSGAYPESASSKVRFRAVVTKSNGHGYWTVGKTGWW